MKMPSPESLITHRSTMLLIDEIIDYNETSLVCVLHPNARRSFAFDDGTVPSWIGLEYMCQAIAALEGIIRLSQNKPITLGFFMGTRRYQAHQKHFEPTDTLLVEIQEEMRSESFFGVFSCKISTNQGTLLAEATIKAAMPDSPEFILNPDKK